MFVLAQNPTADFIFLKYIFKSPRDVDHPMETSLHPVILLSKKYVL